MTSGPGDDRLDDDPAAGDDDLGAAFAPDEPGGDEVVVQVTEEQAQGLYCNLALVTPSQTEFTVDFAFLQPYQATAKLHARILLPPRLAKQLAATMAAQVDEYERRHGAIED